MSNRIHTLIPLLLFSATAGVLAVVMPAQAMPPANDPEADNVNTPHLVPINELFREAFFRNTGDFFFQASFTNQVIQFFGLKYFDNQIRDDSALVTYYLNEVMRQQTDFGELRRGRDLPNPFDTTIQENPCYLRTPSEGYCGK